MAAISGKYQTVSASKRTSASPLDESGVLLHEIVASISRGVA